MMLFKVMIFKVLILGEFGFHLIPFFCFVLMHEI